MPPLSRSTHAITSYRTAYMISIVIFCFVVSITSTQASDWAQNETCSTQNTWHPSYGEHWQCISGAWTHQGDLVVDSEWRELTFLSGINTAWIVDGNLNLSSSIVWPGAIAATIRATRCIHVGEGGSIVLDWSKNGIPKGIGKNWKWSVFTQSQEYGCPNDLSKISVTVKQGGCVNAHVSSTSSDSKDKLILSMEKGSNVCLRNGLLIGILVGIPAILIVVVSIVYIVRKIRGSREKQDAEEEY